MKFNLLALAAIVSLAMAAPVADNAVVEGAGGSPGGKPWKRDVAVTEDYPGGKDW
ncbi:hypothetical protein CTAM01_09685 [Colletotrichum tamarilloi]|uniref:Uncharacterized protein n=1 Tax=Colletotrichum tamarilloi TaxID=1209934 RepID=A0ABQ9R2H5_9PEZI|nr:uncharacterized protein CTAM01_09685 [Colletotrichum tamarilloi]KAK1492734.1 hypothetical protein CTAM01_09685 [Colletotrichum tamarilloi]